MKLTRKIFAFVLMISMVLSMTISGSAVTFSDVPETHERYEAINELSGLGIINGYTDGTFQPDKAVTRAEMAKLIATLFSIEEVAGGENPFSDTADNWALNYIIAVKNLDIINGFPDGTFLPNAEVTYEQAIKMIICALNYGEAAEGYAVEGDWSSGYRTMASRLGLTKNATMLHTDPAPRGIIAQLLFNALDIAPAEKVVDSKGNVSWKPSTSGTVKENKNYSTLKNVQIICTPTINLDDSDKLIKDGYVRFLDSKGDKYDMSVNGNENIYDLIGRFVNVTYEEKSKDYIIKSVSDLSKEKDVDLVKIKNVTGSKIEYYTDDKYSKTDEITIKNPTVIYNERPLVDASDFVDLLNDAITMKLSDDEALNFFGTVEVATSGSNTLLVIKTYKSYWMESSVNSSTYEVTLEGRKNPVVMNVKDTGNYEIVKKTSLTDKGTVQTSSLSIPTKSVVTLCESADNSIGTKYIEYLVNSSKTSGTPSESKTPKGPYSGLVKIGSSELYVTNDEAYSKMSVNSTSSFYKDASGNIVYVASISDGNKRFGFYSEFVSGDTEETDSAVFKFYDPEAKTTFQVTISDPEDIESILKPGKDSGKLFWMNISGSKVKSGNLKYAEDVTSTDDSDITGVAYYSGDKVYGTSSGFVILKGSSEEKITELSSNKVLLPRPDLTKSSVSYKTGSITVNSSVKYPNPEAYQIKRKDGSKTVLLYDALKQLQSSSPVYVVKDVDSISKIGDTDVRPVSYYNFKTGAASAEDDPLLIEANVFKTIGLEKGDVFAYYDDSKTDGVDIDNAETVFVLLKASDVANNRGAGLAFDSELTDFETQNASVTTDGLRKYKVDTTSINNTCYYNYSLTLPLWYDIDNNKLALARTNVSGSSKNTFNTYLSHDSELIDKLTASGNNIFDSDMGWSKESIFAAMGSDTTEKSMSTSVKVFVFDGDAENEDEVLVYKEGISSDDLKVLLGELSTLENNKATDESEIAESAQKCDLIYSYFENGSNNLKTIYIIK